MFEIWTSKMLTASWAYVKNRRDKRTKFAWASIRIKKQLYVVNPFTALPWA